MKLSLLSIASLAIISFALIQQGESFFASGPWSVLQPGNNGWSGWGNTLRGPWGDGSVGAGRFVADSRSILGNGFSGWGSTNDLRGPWGDGSAGNSNSRSQSSGITFQRGNAAVIGNGFSGWGKENEPLRGPWGNKKKRSIEQDDLPSVECSYSQSLKVLECTWLKTTVQCDAIRVLDSRIGKRFNTFAIAALPVDDLQASSTQIKYSLYPESLDKNGGFLNTRVVDPFAQRSFTYSLYQLPTHRDMGVRVARPVCWKMILDLFNEASLSLDNIQIVETRGDKTESVEIIGKLEIL